MKPVITDIPGVGPAAAEALAEHRITTVTQLARASVARITAVPGFSELRAERVIAQAGELIGNAAGAAPRSDESTQPDAGEKQAKKEKGKKKGKDKDKKKGKGKDKKKDKGKGKGKGKGKDKKKGKK